MELSSSASENGLQPPFVVVNRRQNVLLVLYERQLMLSFNGAENQ